MENIIDYIRHTNETFEEKKWNEVDSKSEAKRS